MLAAYWDIGKMINQRQQEEGWGKGVIPRLAIDLKNEISGIKGFSVRNIQMMIQFYIEYKDFAPITQRPVAQLENSESTIRQLPVAKLDNNPITQRPVAQLEDNPITQLPVSQLVNS